MAGPFQVVVCLVEIFLLYFDFRNFVESRARQMIVVVSPYDLFEIENCITQIIQLLQSFCLVEVCFAQCRRLLVGFFGDFC